LADIPAIPSQAPYRDLGLSTKTAIGVVMPEVSGFASGGDKIISYILQVSSDLTNWQQLTGQTENYSLTHFEHAELTSGQYMHYRYAVSNQIG
jgi:hypothetical protein